MRLRYHFLLAFLTGAVFIAVLRFNQKLNRIEEKINRIGIELEIWQYNIPAPENYKPPSQTVPLYEEISRDTLLTDKQ